VPLAPLPVFEKATELILELQFGEGGTDSKLFVHDLMDAYKRYAALKGFKYEIIHEENGHAMLQVRGRGVYDAFRNEAGKHCVQRVPPTETRGRRQTSMISVAVLPIPPEDPKAALLEKDLEITTQTGKQKAGGQNVNKVASAVRIHHKPTGLRVFINGRDQAQNRKEALKIITARVHEMQREKQQAAYTDDRKRQMDGGGRGNKVRTYNFIESRVADHRLGVKTRNIDQVMKGRFDLLFQGEKSSE
jgi:peptide chain release factor 1